MKAPHDHRVHVKLDRVDDERCFADFAQLPDQEFEVAAPVSLEHGGYHR